MGGYGYPTFVYYPPGFWFLALPFSFLISDPVLTTKLVLTLIMIISGIGAYKLARHFCDKRSAYLVTALFYLSPYITMQLYTRGSYSELMALLLSPWVFYHFIALGRRIENAQPSFPSALWFSVWLAIVTYSHATIATWLVMALGICTLGMAWESKKPKEIFLIIGFAVLFSVTLSSPHWLTGFLSKEFVDYQEGIRVWFLHAKSLYKMFNFDSTFCGPILPLLAAAGFCCALRSPFTLAAFLAYFLLLLYFSDLISKSTRYAMTPLHYLQNPYRVLNVAASLQIIGMGLLFGYVEKKWHPHIMQLVGLLAIIWGMTIVQPQQQISITYDHSVTRQSWEKTFENTTHLNEFMPIWASIDTLTPRSVIGLPLINNKLGTIISNIENHGDTDVRFTATNSRRATIIFNQFYFPGWKVMVNNALAEECPIPRSRPKRSAFCADDSGRLLLYLPSGTMHVHVWYDGVPGVTKRNILALILALACFFILRQLCQTKSITQ